MESWSLKYNDWNPQEERLREALCTLGNGYFATRGAGAESNAGKYRYPGTYLAGGYNRLETEINGHFVENEDLVNWPNWLCLNFRIKGGRWFEPDDVYILDYSQELDIKCGVLYREITIKDQQDRKTKLESERFVSMKNPHIAGIRWRITPLNWSDEIEVNSLLDGRVTNIGVERYRDLNSRHLEMICSKKLGEKGILLEVKTNQSEIVMAQAARTEVFTKNTSTGIERENFKESMVIGQLLRFKVEQQKSVDVEKTVTLFSSKDSAISSPRYEASKLLQIAPRFNELLEGHSFHWEQLWNRCDMTLEGNLRETKILRLHIFHLLQTVSMNSIDLDVGVPARGLHGEAYRGHIFWDELFIFPFINLRIPELTRSLLMYRYRRLNEARRAAQNEGNQGARYPWQSGSDGEEESQKLHLNPKSGKWVPDTTYLQIHINAAITYNIWHYFQATDDKEFISMYGAEMVLEIARYWVSVAEYSPEKERYEIKNVVGPDEFHTAYPNNKELGVNNNAYTNFMASWCIRKALDIFDHLADRRKVELMKALKITHADLSQWKHISGLIFIEFNGDIINQFEGYHKLDELDWGHYRRKYGDIQRLDRILGAEGDSPNRYKLNKQADVLMLFYLFSSEEIKEGFSWLDYDFETEQIPKNINYYIERSSEGSTLSRVVHSWILSRVDRTHSWRIFDQALESDITDIQGGTTSEGIHLGAMAGTVDIIQRCYTGIEINNDVLWLNPKLPKELKEVTMRIRYRGHWLCVDIKQDHMNVKVEQSWMPEGCLGFRGEVYSFEQGSRFTFYRDKSRPASGKVA